jgi:hypothetical protein
MRFRIASVTFAGDVWEHFVFVRPHASKERLCCRNFLYYPVFTYLEYLEETDVIIQTSLNETSTGTYLDPLTTIAMEWG